MGRGLWLAQLVVGAASATNGFGFNHSDSRVNPLLPKLPPQSGHDKARRWAALRLATTYGLTAACGTSQRVGWCRGTRPNKDAEQVDLTDRKSTRLNSSHVAISYAVFCLKKKKE